MHARLELTNQPTCPHLIGVQPVEGVSMPVLASQATYRYIAPLLKHFILHFILNVSRNNNSTLSSNELKALTGITPCPGIPVNNKTSILQLSIEPGYVLQGTLGDQCTLCL